MPYRGGAPLIQDLIAGQIDITFGQAANYLDPVRSGQLKAYAVLSKKRWWAAPDVPTIDEAGVPGPLLVVLARALGAEGHAEGRDRQAQHRDVAGA